MGNFLGAIGRWTAGGLLLAVPLGASADGRIAPGQLSYLHASSAENGDAPSTWGFNAVDGKNTTAWCTGGEDPVGQMVVLGFMQKETISSISVVAGQLRGGILDTGHARVRELQLNDGHEKRNITLADQAEPQELQLQPPMQVRQLALVVKDVYPAEGSNPSACLADVTLSHGKTLLTGESVARMARSLPRNKLSLVGVWIDDPSAPERFLTFSLDGTFAWRFEPLMEGSPVTLKGEWDLSGSRLTLKVKGHPKPAVFKVERERVVTRKGAHEQLTLDGEDGHEKLAGEYRPQEIKVY